MASVCDGSVVTSDEKMQKRLGYLPWEDYFLSVAFLSGMRSKDPCSQVGACIVNPDKIIVSIGYNGMPKGCSDDELPWAKQAEDKLNTKYMYVCHAEMNAVINKNSADVAGCTLYVVLFPCNECAKIIIQSRIKEVVYYSTKHKDKPESVASKMMLEMAGISVRQFSPKSLKIEIDFKSKDLDIRSSHEDKISSSLDALPNKDFAPISNDINKKRLNYIAWEEYFMALAFLSAQRSKDPTSQLGACVVDRENKIVGIGYNGMPRGCDDSALPWSTDGTDKMELKYMYVCHAEMNAILNKNCAKISGCKIYATLFPCNECAKFIIQEEIKEVIYFSDKHKDSPEIKAAKKMFTMTGVKYRLYEGNLTKVTVDFSAIDWNKTSQLPPTPGKQFASHLF